MVYNYINRDSPLVRRLRGTFVKFINVHVQILERGHKLVKLSIQCMIDHRVLAVFYNLLVKTKLDSNSVFFGGMCSLYKT